MESYVAVAGAAVLAWLIVRAWRRRAALTPEQRAIEDLQRDQRRLRRAQRRQRDT